MVYLKAFLFGFSFLVGEVLYFKLLDFTVGSYSFIPTITVAIFLLGAGLGSYFSTKISNYFVVAGAISLHNFILIFFNEKIRNILANIIASNPELAEFYSLVFSLIFLVPLSFGIGLFFPYLVEKAKKTSHVFLWEGLGGISGIISFELLLYPSWGLVSTGYFLSGLLLLLGAFSTGLENKDKLSTKIHGKLLAIGILTGGFQSVWLLLINYILGPFYFSKSLVVLIFIAGIFIGSFLVGTFSLSMLLYLVAIAIAITFVAINNYLYLLAGVDFNITMLFLVSLLGLATIFIGAILPQYLVENKNKNRKEVGGANFSLVVGNVIGLISVYICSQWYNEYQLLLFIAGGLLVINLRYWFIPNILIAIFCYHSFTQVNFEEIVKISSPNSKLTEVSKVFRSRGSFGAVYTYPGFTPWGMPIERRRLYQNGYSAIDIDQGHESFIGIIGAAYSKEYNKALVLGSGSGRSAGTISISFNEIDVVDVDPNTKALMEYLIEDNYYLISHPNFKFHQIDAIMAPEFLKDKKYDLIVLTVDPSFHSLAAKLYTKEYFAKLKNMLTDEGVFIFWMDNSFGEDNEDLLLSTARSVFENQKGYWIYETEKGRKTYYLIVNSKTEIRYDIPLNLYYQVRNNRELIDIDLLTDKGKSFDFEIKTEEINTWNKNKVNKLDSVRGYFEKK